MYLGECPEDLSAIEVILLLWLRSWIGTYVEMYIPTVLQRGPHPRWLEKYNSVCHTVNKGYIWCQQSLTVLACKFMEHTCASHINTLLANTHILNSKQHGFRQGLSCQTQLIEAVNDWICSLNSKRGAKTCQITVALFDFSKAFDRVCHKRLLLKLEFYGIRGPMREWIDSFVQDRTKRSQFRE